MANVWQSVRLEDLKKDEPVRTNRGHSFIACQGINWPQYCRFCGHVPLKNDISLLVTKIGCDYELDQRFRQWAKRRAL